MGAIPSSKTDTPNLNNVRETLRVESAPIDVTVTNPPIFLNMADRKELLGLAVQIAAQTNSVDVEARITSIFNTLTALVKGAK